MVTKTEVTETHSALTFSSSSLRSVLLQLVGEDSLQICWNKICQPTTEVHWMPKEADCTIEGVLASTITKGLEFRDPLQATTGEKINFLTESHLLDIVP